MKIFEVFEQKRVKRGISTAELARRVGMEYEALRQSLKGNREIQAIEFLNLCHELELTLENFCQCSSVKNSADCIAPSNEKNNLLNSA